MFTDSKQTFHLPLSDNKIYLGGIDQAWPPIPVRQQEHLMTVRFPLGQSSNPTSSAFFLLLRCSCPTECWILLV